MSVEDSNGNAPNNNETEMTDEQRREIALAYIASLQESGQNDQIRMLIPQNDMDNHPPPNNEESNANREQIRQKSVSVEEIPPPEQPVVRRLSYKIGSYPYQVVKNVIPFGDQSDLFRNVEKTFEEKSDYATEGSAGTFRDVYVADIRPTGTPLRKSGVVLTVDEERPHHVNLIEKCARLLTGRNGIFRFVRGVEAMKFHDLYLGSFAGGDIIPFHRLLPKGIDLGVAVLSNADITGQLTAQEKQPIGKKPQLTTLKKKVLPPKQMKRKNSIALINMRPTDILLIPVETQKEARLKFSNIEGRASQPIYVLYVFGELMPTRARRS